MLHRGRIAGVTVPLFSLRSDRSWGLGEIADLPDFAAWAREAGIRLVQILPLGEISGGDTSPYSAISAFGIDPMYVSISAVPDLDERDWEGALGDGGLAWLDHVRRQPRVDYQGVRTLKARALRRAFERFIDREARPETERARAFKKFCDDNAEWLEDYALFRALKDAHGGRAWFDWSPDLRARDEAALRDAGAKFATDVAFYRYAQWLAHEQWYLAKKQLGGMDVEVMGDLPFMVARDSADVWARREEFDDTRSVGVPPDQFNAEGQDWGLPTYAWNKMRATDFAWLRRRARYTASLYDRFRIDHLVGFYRTYSRPLAARFDAKGKLVAGEFDPKDEKDQIAHGERVIGAIRDSARELGSQLIAEDLGVIPKFVRPSLTALGVPGYKVLIWEKQKVEDKDVFLDPKEYPALSVACFGTHDTDPLAVWWETRDEAERAAVLALPGLAGKKIERQLDPATHATFVELLSAAGSDLVLFLIQDVLATRDRINVPATTGPQNWSYRLPESAEAMRKDPEVRRISAMVRATLEKTGRA